MREVKDSQPQLFEVEGFGQRVGAESQEYAQASAAHKMTEGDDHNIEVVKAKDLMEAICERENLELAAHKVARNAGAGGVDGMKADEIEEWLASNYEALSVRLLAGRYKPLPVRRVEIPKTERGKTRKLGIPTVIDRMVEQAVVEVLTPIYEPLFSDASFGFRPGKSAHDALLKVKELADEGYVWAASIDLERFFDTVNQSRLLQILSETIKDGQVISLIHKFLRAGVMEGGVVVKTQEGTPQGGPLSPLLANVMLNELDRELEARGHAFVRYADDILILKKTEKAARRALESMSRFIERRLYLKVNREKSYVAYITDTQVKYLGYGFYRNKGELRFRAHQKSLAKLKDKVRAILARSNGWSFDLRRYRLKVLVRGWTNYFKLADMKEALTKIDTWLRRKIRCVYWKCWKRIRTKFRALVKLGISRGRAWQWANSRKAYWRVAGSAVLEQSLTMNKLTELGWAAFLPYYRQLRCEG